MSNLPNVVVLSSESEGELPKKKRMRCAVSEKTESVIVLSSDDSDAAHGLESDLSDEELEAGPSRVKTLDPSCSPIKKPPAPVEPQAYLHDLHRLPIFCNLSKSMSTAQCVNMLLDPELQRNVVCEHVPFGVNCNSSFIIDMNCLSNPKDILCDDMGTWKWKGSYRSWLLVDKHGFVTALGKDIPDSPSSMHYRIWKRYYCNKSSPDVKKMVVFLEDSSMDTLSLAIVQYIFTTGEHEVKIAPHGNSKGGESYVRTMPSVLTKLKSTAAEKTAKRALAFVAQEAGGIESAHSASALPRGRQQVDDIRRASLSNVDTDPLYAMMVMCKESEGKNAPEAFVRMVNAAPFPMMVLAFDWTLDDLVRFCTNVDEFCVLGFDPTFNLGPFDVTVTTYRHMLLQKKNEPHRHPTMIGPLFIHVKKDYPTYHFFASTLVSRRPDLANLRCFGTDGEAALVNALSTVFPHAIHLRCFLHFRGNIEEKLRQLNLPQSVLKEIVYDVLGNPSQLQRGLVDAENESEFDSMLTGFQNSWDELESPFNSPPQFHAWFLKNCRDTVARCMLRCVREDAGLGSPPEPYYTNEIESKNNILKQHVGHKAFQLPEFVEHMKELLHEQRKEVERAVATSGEYRVVSHYSNLACTHQKWFRMSQQQRENKVNRFMKATLCSVSSDDDASGSSNPLNELDLPSYVKETVWNRAKALVQDQSAMVPAPGDDSALMVMSNSGQQPHYVRQSKAGGYLCDDRCLGYKSSKICSHTVAAALKNGTISGFIRWYQTMKCKPNFTKLSESGKPTTAGQKPKRKGAPKKVTKKVQNILASASEDSFDNRAHLTCSSVCATMSSSVDSSSLATTVAPNQARVSVQSFGFQSPVVVSQFSHGPPPLVHASVYPLSPTSGDPVPSSDTENPSQRPSPCTGQTPPGSHLGTGWMQGAYFRPSETPGTWPTVHPSLQASTHTCCSPVPPLASDVHRPDVGSPFWLCFVHGNISRCNGCKGRIARGQDKKPLPPPDDLVIRHRENVLFLNPNTGVYQQSREARNVYYHPWRTCIAPHFKAFIPSQHINVDREILNKFVDCHYAHIEREFGLSFQ